MNESITVTLSGIEAANYLEYRERLKSEGYSCLEALLSKIKEVEAASKEQNKYYKYIEEREYIMDDILQKANKLDRFFGDRLDTSSSSGCEESHETERHPLLAYIGALSGIDSLMSELVHIAKQDESITSLKETWTKATSTYQLERAEEYFTQCVNNKSSLEVAKLKQLHKIDRRLDKQHLVRRLRKWGFCW